MDLFSVIALHGVLTVGLTTYPALESRFTLTAPALAPKVAVEVLARTPISRPEPITLQAGVHVTVWEF